ncbi:MAG: hypothetical protein NC124_13020 [Clostridium sp.]|nr:hypothetical protein [Clostridium sp.]
MKRVAKKLAVWAMALVVLVSFGMPGQAVTTANAKKAKSKYKAYLAYEGGGVMHYEFHKGGKVYVKNKKGKAKYTITMKLDQCNDNRNEEDKNKKVKDTSQLELWINDIASDHKEKDINISNIVVKCDGKKVKLNSKKIEQGFITGEDDVKRYWVNIFGYNAKTAKASAFNWKDEITVSFTVNIKK